MSCERLLKGTQAAGDEECVERVKIGSAKVLQHVAIVAASSSNENNSP